MWFISWQLPTRCDLRAFSARQHGAVLVRAGVPGRVLGAEFACLSRSPPPEILEHGPTIGSHAGSLVRPDDAPPVAALVLGSENPVTTT